MSEKYNEFKKKYLGKRVDYDLSYWYQCVDLAKQYVKEIYKIALWSFGWDAYTWFLNKSNTFNLDLFDKIIYSPWMSPQPWDIVFFNRTSSNGNCWHVWISWQSSPDKLVILEQNYTLKNIWTWLWDAAITERTRSYKDVSGWFRYKGDNKAILNTIINNIMKEYVNIKRYNLFNTSDADYSKTANIWDIKDLIEIAVFRFDEKKNSNTLTTKGQ